MLCQCWVTCKTQWQLDRVKKTTSIKNKNKKKTEIEISKWKKQQQQRWWRTVLRRMAAYPFGHTAFGGAPNDAAINCNSSYSERPYYRKREKKKFRRFFFFFLVFPQSQKKNIPDIMVLLIIILQWYNQLPKHQFLDRKKLLPTTTNKSWRRFFLVLSNKEIRKFDVVFFFF